MRILVAMGVAGLLLVTVTGAVIWAGQRRAMYFPFGGAPARFTAIVFNGNAGNRARVPAHARRRGPGPNHLRRRVARHGGRDTAGRRTRAGGADPALAVRLVIAGDRDAIIPIDHSRRLFDAANEPKQFVVIPGAGHNDFALLAGTRMIDAIVAFLSARAR